MLSPPPPLRVFEKVASLLSLLNALISFSPPGLVPDRVLGLQMKHGPLTWRPWVGGDVLTHLWPGVNSPCEPYAGAVLSFTLSGT